MTADDACLFMKEKKEKLKQNYIPSSFVMDCWDGCFVLFFSQCETDHSLTSAATLALQFLLAPQEGDMPPQLLSAQAAL